MPRKLTQLVSTNALYLAQFEGPRFFFEACGHSEQQARVILRSTILSHCRATGATISDFYCPDEVFVRKITAGAGFRDREQIYKTRVVKI